MTAKKISSYLLFLLLSGCASKTHDAHSKTTPQQAVIGLGVGAAAGVATGVLVPGLLVGGAFGGIIGHNMQIKESKYLQQVDALNAKGVQIIQNGDEVRFVLPAKNFFSDASNNILSAQEKTIMNLAKLINALPATIIQVAGFSSKYGSIERNRSLALARANRIRDSLGKYAIDSRIMYTALGGELLPIDLNNEDGDGNISNRVEVTLNPVEHLNIG